MPVLRAVPVVAVRHMPISALGAPREAKQGRLVGVDVRHFGEGGWWEAGEARACAYSGRPQLFLISLITKELWTEPRLSMVPRVLMRKLL